VCLLDVLGEDWLEFISRQIFHIAAMVSYSRIQLVCNDVTICILCRFLAILHSKCPTNGL
jgi:hypothetical protein